MSRPTNRPVKRRPIRVPPLPEARVRELAARGLSTVRIAVELEAEGHRCGAHHVREVLRPLGLLPLSKRGRRRFAATEAMRATARAMHAQRRSRAEIARTLGIAASTVKRHADALGIEGETRP